MYGVRHRVFTSTLNEDTRWGFQRSFVQSEAGRSQLFSDTDVGNNPPALSLKRDEEISSTRILAGRLTEQTAEESEGAIPGLL